MPRPAPGTESLCSSARAREYDEAENTIRRFVDFDPAPPVALRANGLRQLARIKKAQQKPDEAQALHVEADELDPTVWEVHPLPPADLYKAPVEP